MNQIKPEDRPKAILLVLAILAVFGFSAGNILRLLNPGGGDAPAPTPSPAPATEVAAVTGQANTPAPLDLQQPAGAPGAAAETEQVLLPNLRNNPFREIPKIMPTPEPIPTPAPVREVRSPETPRLQLGSVNSARTIPLPLPKSAMAAPSPGALPITPVAPPPPALVLKGIISGDDALALIQQGERQLIVRIGQFVGGYKVVGITVDDVLLRRGKTLKTLSVGAPGVVAIRDATPEPRYPLDEGETVAPKPRRRVRPASNRASVVVRHVVVYPGERAASNPVPDVAEGPTGTPVALDVPLAPQPSISAPAASAPGPVSLPAREIDPEGAMPTKPDGVEPPKPADAPPPASR